MAPYLPTMKGTRHHRIRPPRRRDTRSGRGHHQPSVFPRARAGSLVCCAGADAGPGSLGRSSGLWATTVRAMNGRRDFAVVVSFAVAVLAGFGCSNGATPEWRQHSFTAAGIHFKCPASFQIGRHADMPEAERARQVVLVESSVIGGRNPNELLLGEQSTICLRIEAGEDASYLAEAFFTDEFRTKIGAHTVYNVGAFPGPYGDESFYYLIPLPNGKILEIMGNRHYFRGVAADGRRARETNYGAIIRGIVRSLTFAPEAVEEKRGHSE